MTARAQWPEKEEIQKLVAIGYEFHRSRSFVLTLADAKAGRDFIGKLVARNWITYVTESRKEVKKLKIEDEKWKLYLAESPADVSMLAQRGGCATSIGFTYRGLEALGLSGRRLEVIQEKARAFAEGAFFRASRRLADTGRSAPELWRARFKPDVAHVFLTLHGDEEKDLETYQAALQALSRGAFDPAGWTDGFEGCHLVPDDKERTSRRVHFGYLDGISRTGIVGFPTRMKIPIPGTEEYKAGEFLLGYANESGFNPWLLATEEPGVAGFFRNGSFGAFRQMEQDERGFNDYVTAWSVKLRVDKSYLKAKFCGRWEKYGHVVKPGQDTSPPAPEGKSARSITERLNNFDYSDDPDGEGCPFGAHIRRMNPRKDPFVPFRRRPLIRRGMPYGPTYKEDSKAERGLLGLFFCASLEDQFEHLLCEWGDSNPMGPNNRGNAKDPLIGQHDNPAAVFDIPIPGDDLLQLNDFRPFVTTRGTLYAFFPSRTALGMIANLGKPAA